MIKCQLAFVIKLKHMIKKHSKINFECCQEINTPNQGIRNCGMSPFYQVNDEINNFSVTWMFALILPRAGMKWVEHFGFKY